MKFLTDCNSITVTSRKDNASFAIDTLKYYKEGKTKVVLKCAEYIPYFERGFSCDFNFDIGIMDCENKSYDPIHEKVEDLLLVYINKKLDDVNGSLWEYEYIFYK